MKIALLSDIHANKSAMGGVIEHASEKGAMQFCSLGDLIGYGSDPLECIKLATEKKFIKIPGNHEKMLVLLDDMVRREEIKYSIQDLNDPVRLQGLFRQFPSLIPINDPHLPQNADINDAAIHACLITWLELQNNDPYHFIDEIRSGLTESHRIIELDGHIHTIILDHGTYHNPLQGYGYPWNDVVIQGEIQLELRKITKKNQRTIIFCFGHSHIPALFVQNARGDLEEIDFTPGEQYTIDSEMIVINPGSVGNPRDGDRRASYGLLELSDKKVKISLQRVKYDYDDYIRRSSRKNYPRKITEEILTPKLAGSPTEEHQQKLKRRAGEDWVFN